MSTAKTVVVARPAATVILVAPFQFFKATNQFKSNYRIFMVKRSYESKFMSGKKNMSKSNTILGAYVFPGGAVENSTDSSFSNNIPQHSDQIFRVCAVREAFEESGIALFKNITNYGSLGEWRSKIHHNASELINFCNEQKCAPDVDSLLPVAHWVTPLQESKSKVFAT